MNREVKGPSGQTYRPLRTLGSGATAKTWLAQTRDNRLVVMKEPSSATGRHAVAARCALSPSWPSF